MLFERASGDIFSIMHKLRTEALHLVVRRSDFSCVHSVTFWVTFGMRRVTKVPRSANQKDGTQLVSQPA